MKIVDCTLRDGGYYTQWDFSDDIVDSYLRAANALPIDYVELGYRSLPADEYMGKYAYTPVHILRKLRENCNRKIALMLNEKSVSVDALPQLLSPIVGMADMIRLAVDPRNFARAVKLANEVREYGFEIGFNVMYMSQWQQMPEFIGSLSAVNGLATVFNMVDSYGGVMPDDVCKITGLVKTQLSCPLGFHGHNNLHMALANALAACDNGVEYIDATVCGMGRGAGNLELELLLSVMSKQGIEVDFNELGDIVDKFAELKDKYHWGATLPYMISGVNSLPQKQVMDWVANRTYSFNSIVRALSNQTAGLEDNAKYAVLEKQHIDEVVIVGGGQSVTDHADALRCYLAQHPQTSVIFASTRRLPDLDNIDNKCYYCLVGSEAKRMSQNVTDLTRERTCILPPYPRQMGTDVPELEHVKVYELNKVEFTDDYTDSCTAVALQLALDLCANNVYLCGYDGYPNGILSEKESTLSLENRYLFNRFCQYSNKKLISLTPTIYPGIENQSLYQYI